MAFQSLCEHHMGTRARESARFEWWQPARPRGSPRQSVFLSVLFCLTLQRVDAGSESLELCSTSGTCSLDELVAVLPEAEPRFFLCKLDGGDPLSFLLYCPEAAKAALKMLYATAKAAFISRLEQLSLKPSQQLQSGDATEVRADLAPAADTGKDAAFAKPTRPGRGRARVLG